jgi:hypothetical protein
MTLGITTLGTMILGIIVLGAMVIMAGADITVGMTLGTMVIMVGVATMAGIILMSVMLAGAAIPEAAVASEVQGIPIVAVVAPQATWGAVFMVVDARRSVVGVQSKATVVPIATDAALVLAQQVVA